VTDGAATVVRLRVHQFAKLRGVSTETVWLWIEKGKVAAEKDEGGHRWFVVTKINTREHPEGTVINRKQPVGESETA
jgi:predicted site-specific integrase-resolvase